MASDKDYLLATGTAAAHRLQLIQRIFGPTTESLLTRVGLRPGMRVLDVGCGIGTVSCWMAERVGPDGSVVGVDASDEQVDIARQSATDAGLGNVTFQVADAYDTGLARESFDLVYSRLLLCHLTQPDAAVREMGALVRPGGLLVCEDLDLASAFTEPSSPSFLRMIEILLSFTKKRGIDHCVGRRLHRLLRQPGFDRPAISFLQPAYLDGEEKRIWEYTLIEAAPALIESGLTTRQEVTGVAEALKEMSEDEESLIALSRVSQAWTRKLA